ncbi:MAG: PIG-L family deacetylase [Clostridia bacterium]|nr:PIG-L family deacetylase [Clostridia bacterium]
MQNTISKKRFIKLTLFILILLSLLFAFICSASATETPDTNIKDLAITPNYRYLRDGNYNTSANTQTITVSSENNIDSIYLVFWTEATGYTVTSNGVSLKIENTFLHSYTKLTEDFVDCKELTITLDKAVNVSDVYAFTEGTLPDWVHVWQQPHEKADILLNSTHADDEQLFFAGVLPYHVAKGYRVQIVYFTDHRDTPGRRHELLNGLWTVGVDHYPVISRFPDAYSTSYQGALNNVVWAGYSETDVLEFQTEVIRRFKPQVIVGHDLNGEYGHGQHMLNIETLIKAVENASNKDFFSKSAEKYGTWDTPKLYVHLYGENQITMNWDEPLEYFGGKSAFQMSQAGYKKHDSQQYTWFTDWLNGYNGSITQASQIKTYSPCLYGLYRTTVGEDVEKNSFFENLISYDEQERIEQERLEQERLEKEEQKRREEEESRRLEEESRRIESESIAESIRIAESEKAESERLKRQEELDKKNSAMTKTIAAIVLVSAVILLSVILIKKYRK